ncbi:uncharacterized protein LOC134214541 [Armigeres subalbatus]|uniref:uncharacterized protein LOC134214541 n=1 Tax=Armigeres subalbatus TaxID=124917 RepID=UPI002ED60319
MFTVAQFFEKQQLRVLAVPVSWLRDGFLMWPKIPSNEKLDKLRMEGVEFNGATKRIPAISSRKYKSSQAAEAAAEELLKQDVSDIEAKRKLLKHRKDEASKPRPLKDYNKVIQEISSSKKALQFKSDHRVQQKHNLEDQVAGPSYVLHTSAQECASEFTETQVQAKCLQRQNHATPKKELCVRPGQLAKVDDTRHMTTPNPVITFQACESQVAVKSSTTNTAKKPISVTQPHSSQQFNASQAVQRPRMKADHLTCSASSAMMSESQQDQPVFVSDDNIIYINTPSAGAEAIELSNIQVDSLQEAKAAVLSLQSEMVALGAAVATLRNDMTSIRTEITHMKDDIVNAIRGTIRQVVVDCLEESLPRFATMIEIDKRYPVAPQEGKLVGEHKHINDEDELLSFNKILASKQVFEDYVKYFTKIIPPATYYEKGDSACYLIVDCLFTRTFWNSFTWTGINRGNKSKRGFREFVNVLQLLLAIVSVGDPTYSSIKLESFCKNRLFRYSKARSSSKQPRKSTCRKTRIKKCKVDEGAEQVYDEDRDDMPLNNMTTDSNNDESSAESDYDAEMESHVDILMQSDED